MIYLKHEAFFSSSTYLSISVLQHKQKPTSSSKMQFVMFLNMFSIGYQMHRSLSWEIQYVSFDTPPCNMMLYFRLACVISEINYHKINLQDSCQALLGQNIKRVNWFTNISRDPTACCQFSPMLIAVSWYFHLLMAVAFAMEK